MSADLALYLDLDIAAPSLRRCRSLTDRMPQGLGPLTAGATLALEVRPHRSGTVATDLTVATKKPRLILKVKGPTGDVELARLNTTAFSVITESSVDVGWSADLPLTSAALRAYFADGADTKLANLELTLVADSGELKPLYLASTALLAGYLAPEAGASDEDSTVPSVRSDITTHAAMRALVTVGLTVPKLYHFLIGGNWETWTLRAKAVSGENDDDVSYIEPADGNASTNNVVFVKTTIA